jgi:hypothetical protein
MQNFKKNDLIIFNQKNKVVYNIQILEINFMQTNQELIKNKVQLDSF